MVYVRIAGGLANQIYQYMGGYALSRELGQKLMLDISMCTGGYTRGFLLNCFPNIRYDGLIKNTSNRYAGTVDNIAAVKKSFLNGKHILIMEKNGDITDTDIEEYHGIDSKFDKSKKDYYLCGNWIGKEYWDKYIGELRNIFFAPIGMDTYIEEFQKKDLKCAVGVHIRRGDFVYHGYTEDDDPEYFRGAVRFLEEKNSSYEFYIFSDDKKYAESILGNKSEKIHYVNSMEGLWGDVVDFCCLSLCEIKIISGKSTYSKLAFDLNPSKGKKYIVKNVNDIGIKHKIRNIGSLHSIIPFFECINMNRTEYQAYSLKYSNQSGTDFVTEDKKITAVNKCRYYYDKSDYEKAEQIAHKIWSWFDDKEEFHDLYGKILYGLKEKKEAAIELSRTEKTDLIVDKETEELICFFKSVPKFNVMIIPDRQIRGISSLNGMILIAVILRRLGHDVELLVKHDDYYGNYLKKSEMLTDQDGTGYDCKIISVNDNDNEQIENKIKIITDSGGINLLICNGDVYCSDLVRYKLSEKQFEIDEEPVKIREFKLRDIFRIDEKYFDIIRQILEEINRYKESKNG